MYKLIIALTLVTLVFIACKKKTEISTTPVIEFKGVNKYQIKEYSDSLQITISYTDSDGDIGENDPNKKNIFLTDTRTNTVLEYRVKEIVPNKQTVSITGTINVVIDKIYINSTTASTEALSYKIQLIDRAGNKSNEVQTGVITLTK